MFQYFQNRTIGQDISKGILISGNSLVLQKIRREQAGNYSCYASNLEGDTQSKHIQIQVKCKFFFQLCLHSLTFSWDLMQLKSADGVQKLNYLKFV